MLHVVCSNDLTPAILICGLVIAVFQQLSVVVGGIQADPLRRTLTCGQATPITYPMTSLCLCNYIKDKANILWLLYSVHVNIETK